MADDSRAEAVPSSSSGRCRSRPTPAPPGRWVCRRNLVPSSHRNRACVPPTSCPVVGLTFGLLVLAPLARGDGQPEPSSQAKPAEVAAAADAKAPPAVALPITRVVLFNAGVGYFHREGDVTGDARLDLRFDEADVNDLLKSLVLTDKDGGKVRAVTYDNRMPVDFTLKGFAVDVTENPTDGPAHAPGPRREGRSHRQDRRA